MHFKKIFLLFLICLIFVAASEARERPSSLDSTDRMTYEYEGEPVPFGQNTDTAYIEVTNYFEINDVDVTVHIDHPWDSDIHLMLISPDGETIELVDFAGGSGDNMHDTEFNDAATISITQGSPPFTGSFRPIEELEAFNGGGGTGIWKLVLDDNFPTLDDGVMNWWRLTLGGLRDGILRGHVTEFATGNPMAGVTVASMGGEFSTMTDDSGNYWLFAQEGIYQFAITLDGWCDVMTDSIAFETSDTVVFDAQMRAPTLFTFISSANILLGQNSTTEFPIQIGNGGNCDLEWTAQTFAEWVIPDVSAGMVAAGDTIVLLLHVNAAGLPLGDYQTRLEIHHNALNSPEIFPILLTVTEATAVENPDNGLPTQFALHGSYPNPFNAETTISYALPSASQVRLSLYDMNGRFVTSLADGFEQAGFHEIYFNASRYASGTYIVAMNAGDFAAAHKIVLLK